MPTINEINIGGTTYDINVPQTGQILKNGVSKSWVNGRDGAGFRMNTINQYSPAISLKTSTGSWEIGTYDNNTWKERLIFTYTTDTNYSNNNNEANKFYITKDGDTNLHEIGHGLTLLYTGHVNSGTITLNDSIRNYDFLLSVVKGNNSYGACFTIPVDVFINVFSPTGGGTTSNYWMQSYYGTAGVGFQYTTDTTITFRWQSSGFLERLYGLKLF